MPEKLYLFRRGGLFLRGGGLGEVGKNLLNQQTVFLFFRSILYARLCFSIACQQLIVVGFGGPEESSPQTFLCKYTNSRPFSHTALPSSLRLTRSKVVCVYRSRRPRECVVLLSTQILINEVKIKEAYTHSEANFPLSTTILLSPVRRRVDKLPACLIMLPHTAHAPALPHAHSL